VKLALLLAIALGACVPSEVAPAPSDAGAAESACAHVTSFCGDSTPIATCADRVRVALEQHHTTAKEVDCAAAVASKGALAACGPFFRCP
jgi:hypothetical protein